MSYRRCSSFNVGDRCRLDVRQHKYDWKRAPIHKYWNSYGTRTWIEPMNLKLVVGVVAVVLAIVLISAHWNTVNPNTWNHSDVEIECTLGGLSVNQTTHEYSSCVHVIDSSAVWKRWN